MAINLWKLGGKPTSYNPLPFGYQNIPINTGDYIFKCKAKSSLGGTFEITESGTDEFMQYFVLNSEFQDIVFSFSKKKSGEVFLIRDRFTTGDVIVEDIQLVRKPLPKLTINGIDGFNSGKWALHANAKVIDAETLELNATGGFQESILHIPVLPNSDYTLTYEGSGTVFASFHRTPQSWISNVANGSPWGKDVSYKTPNECYIIVIKLSNYTTGKFIFKKPMLNLGTTPAPYEPKRGERMVLPSVKGKNLFDVVSYVNLGVSFSSLVGVHGFKIVNRDVAVSSLIFDLKPNTQHTISYTKSNTNTIRLEVYDVLNGMTKYFDSSAIADVGKITFTTNSSSKHRIKLHSDNGTDFNYVMLNEGTTALPYEPYSVQLNKKPKRYVPKKNLFDGQLESGYYGVGSGIPTSSANHRRTINYIPIVSSKSYTLSKNTANNFYIHYYSGAKNFISSVQYTTLKTVVIASHPSNAVYCRFHFDDNGSAGVDYTTYQLEEGTTATPHEPYQLVLPKAKSGVALNGQTDYLQFPSMTMDSIEIDCLIDGTQTGSRFIFDTRLGYGNGFVQIGGFGTDIKKFYIDNVDTSPAHGNLVKDKRVNMKFIFNNSFTDDITIFGNYIGNSTTLLKGTLYKVTIYLGNQVVATYDFEKENDLVKPFVLGKPKWGKKKAKRTLESKR